MKPEVAVVIPTYDEAENVRPLIGRLRVLPVDPRVIIVDDASPDGTGKIVAEIAKNDARVHLIARPRKLGLGTAHKAGIALARELGADYVTTMDADLSHEPERVPALVASATETQGLAIGSRYVKGGSSDYGSGRQILSRTANLLARLAIGGAPVRDATAGFRCYSRRALERIDWDLVTSEGYSFLVEVCAHARIRGIKITEVPIVFRDRVAGVSKISRREVYKAVLTLVRVVLKRIQGVSHTREKERRSQALRASGQRPGHSGSL